MVSSIKWPSHLICIIDCSISNAIRKTTNHPEDKSVNIEKKNGSSYELTHLVQQLLLPSFSPNLFAHNDTEQTLVQVVLCPSDLTPSSVPDISAYQFGDEPI